MGQVQIIALIFLALFMVIMVGVGVISVKRTQTMQGFLLGGRKIGAWMSAFAYGTTYFSAVIFIGYAGKIGWGIGLSGVWIGVGNAVIGSLLAWLILAKKTRNMTHRLEARTMPEFFSARYQSKSMKIISALVIFIFLLPYSASVYMGLGYLFNSVFPGVSYIYCMAFMAVLTAVYLVLGGYVATAMTDFIQGIIMIIGVITLVACILFNPAVGGLTEGLSKLKDINPDLVSIFGGKNWQSLLSLVILTSLGTWGLPQMITKFYAVKDNAAIKKATTISTLFAALIAGSAYFIGIFGRLILNNQPPMAGGKPVFDKIVPDMLMKALSDGVFSNIVLAIILLLVLSASMSTLSSLVLTSSSSIAVDLWGEIKHKKSNSSQMLFIRLLCLLFVLLSFLFASLKISFIISLMAFSWGTVAGCFIGPYVWGLYWKGTTKIGAMAGMLSGLISMGYMVFFKLQFAPFKLSYNDFAVAQANSPKYGSIAMIISFVIVPLVSLVTKKYSKAHIDKVFIDKIEQTDTMQKEEVMA